MEAVISNRIYFRPPTTADLRKVVKALTYEIQPRAATAKTKFAGLEIIKNYKLYPGGLVSIPQGREDLLPEDTIYTDKRILYPAPFPFPKYPLRDVQEEVYNQVDDSCFINALVGWGKTFTALYIARKLGQRTLIVTHTTMLRDQWVEEIRSLFGMEPGIIGSGKYNIEDKAIVVGNIQSLVPVIDRINKEFGTVILDEAHHVPATTFSKIIDSMYSRYRIALSGTMERLDGKHVLFKDYFGGKVFRPAQSHTLNPVVKIIKTGISLPPGASHPLKMNILLSNDDYQRFIAGIALAQIEDNHKVLIIADRVEFLKRVKDYIGESCVLVTGETGFENRKTIIEQIETGEKMCIAGSRQIFSEGISVNSLSCVILATPTSNKILLEQIIGRIMRIHPNKKQPVVIDLNFASATEKRQNAARLAFYLSKGWRLAEV